MKPEEYSEKKLTVEGFPIRIVSYRLGTTYHVSIDNVSPGARIARAEGTSLKEAEKAALADATRRLARTRRGEA